VNSILYSSYSASLSKEMFVDHSYPWKRVGFQESVSMETCLSTRSVAVGVHVTVSVFDKITRYKFTAVVVQILYSSWLCHRAALQAETYVLKQHSASVFKVDV
jgi:hypothetical protein